MPEDFNFFFFFKVLWAVLSGNEKSAEDPSEGKQRRNGKWTLCGFPLHIIIAGLVHPVHATLIASLELERVEYFDSFRQKDQREREGKQHLAFESKELRFWVFFW